MFLRDAGEGVAGGQLPLLPFDRMGKGGQSALFIQVPLKPAIAKDQIDLYSIMFVVSNS